MLIDTIRKILRASSPTVQQLGDAVAMARKAEVAARAEVSRQAKLVSDGFMDDAVKRGRDRADLASLREAAEDAVDVLAEAERRHALTLAADEKARRQVVYAGAKERADSAVAALSKSYPKACQDLVGVLKTLAEAQLAVAAANAELPIGAIPIPDPEFAVRSVPDRPREVVSEEVLELWSRADQDTPLPAEFHHEVYATAPGWGRRPGDLEAAFRRRRFRRLEVLEAVPGSYPVPLAVSLRLPGVRGDGFMWGSNAVDGYDYIAAAALRGEGEPGAVLGRLAAIEAAAVAKPAPVKRKVRIEWELLGDVEPLPAGPAPSYSAEPSRRSSSNVSSLPSQPFAAPAAAGRR